jgi:hypothetical protein
MAGIEKGESRNSPTAWRALSLFIGSAKSATAPMKT